jgi:hypothetical protein
MHTRTTFWLLGHGALAACLAAPQSAPDVPARHLTSKSIKAVSYQVGGGSTKIDLRSTSLVPNAAGERN